MAPPEKVKFYQHEIDSLHAMLNRLIDEGFILGGDGKKGEKITETGYGMPTKLAVRELQKKLNELGVRDYEGKPLAENGIFNYRTKTTYQQYVLQSKPIAIMNKALGFEYFPVEKPQAIAKNFGQAREGYKTAHGAVVRGHFHKGVDIVADFGSKVFAVKAGEIVTANKNAAAAGGKYVVIKHTDGSVTKYMHLETVAVSAGMKIGGGEKIGTVGRTGLKKGSNSKTHLHFEYLELNKNGKLRHADPFKLLQSASGKYKEPEGRQLAEIVR